MATISKIRKNSGLVIAAIGIAILGFLISDAFERGIPALNQTDRYIGVIGEEQIDPRDFQEKLNVAINNQKSQLQPDQSFSAEMESMVNDQVWQIMVEELVMDKEYTNIGIEVTGAEIKELILGANPHQIAMQYLVSDRATGKYEKDKILQFMNRLEEAAPEQKEFWLQFEKYLVQERSKEKYNSILKNALYLTDLEAKNNFYANNQVSSFKYVQVPLSVIPDSNFTVTDDEIKAYMNKRKEEYTREQSRDIEFVTFDINTRKEDSIAAQGYINTQVEAFRTSRNDSGFVARRGKASNGFVAKGSFKEIPDDKLEEMWNADSGAVFGPYLENGTYNVIKMGAKKSDSAFVYKASHILIKPAGMTKMDTLDAKTQANEIMAKIKKGESFEVIAKDKSQDPGSAIKGGDLGWFKPEQMVPEFGNAVKAAKLGDVVMATSQFGVHIIKVTAPRSNTLRKIAMLEKKIEPGSETEKLAYTASNKFRTSIVNADDFNKKVQEFGLNKRIASSIKQGDKNIPGLTNAREISRWVYEKNTKIGDISSPIPIGNQWIVAKVTAHQEEGMANIELVREQIKPILIAEKKKEAILKKSEEAYSKSGKNIEQYAKLVNQPVSRMDNSILNNTALPNAPNEPFIVGYANGMKTKTTSKPLVGNNGVYVLMLETKSAPNAPNKYDSDRIPYTSMEGSRFSSLALALLKEQAKVKDRRYMYY